jgi:hypothetical protein
MIVPIEVSVAWPSAIQIHSRSCLNSIQEISFVSSVVQTG